MVPEKQVTHHALDVGVGCHGWVVLQVRVQWGTDEPVRKEERRIGSQGRLADFAMLFLRAICAAHPYLFGVQETNTARQLCSGPDGAAHSCPVPHKIPDFYLKMTRTDTNSNSL